MSTLLIDDKKPLRNISRLLTDAGASAASSIFIVPSQLRSGALAQVVLTAGGVTLQGRSDDDAAWAALTPVEQEAFGYWNGSSALREAGDSLLDADGFYTFLRLPPQVRALTDGSGDAVSLWLSLTQSN